MAHAAFPEPPKVGQPEGTPARTDRGDTLFARALLAGLVAAAMAYAVGSLSWRPVHDVPLAIYSAFSHAEFGTKPYAELFEISFPGTLLAHLAVAAVFGYGDFGTMLANLLCLLLIVALTIVLLRPFGRAVGVGASALFAVAFFMCGPTMMLQRDFFLLVPVVAATVLHCHATMRPWLRRLAIGVAVGAAAAVKPHAAIALVVFAGADLPACRRRGARTGELVGGAVAYAVGFLMPCATVFGWLVSTGGFAAWREMSSDYLPLYLALDRYHEATSGAARWLGNLRFARELGGHWPWFAAAALGTFHTLSATASDTDGPRARVVRLLVALSIAFAIYPAFAGQFWGYHYVPFLYFLCLLSGLCLVPCDSRSRLVRLAPKAALLFGLLVHPDVVSSTKWLFRSPAVSDGQVDAMAGFLRERLRPGDTVQPLDWTGGAVHAMLIAKARLATRFMYDYHFHHHVSEPFIQELRRRFLDEFDSSRPRFVIEYFGEHKPWPSGEDTSRSFDELEQRLADRYTVAASGPEWRIHQRAD